MYAHLSWAYIEIQGKQGPLSRLHSLIDLVPRRRPLAEWCYFCNVYNTVRWYFLFDIHHDKLVDIEADGTVWSKDWIRLWEVVGNHRSSRAQDVAHPRSAFSSSSFLSSVCFMVSLFNFVFLLSWLKEEKSWNLPFVNFLFFALDYVRRRRTIAPCTLLIRTSLNDDTRISCHLFRPNVSWWEQRHQWTLEALKKHSILSTRTCIYVFIY